MGRGRIVAEALFDLPTSYARLSDDGLYRYTLGRRWTQDLDAGAAVFVMLNPSTADAELDDPTIRRCIGFAKALGCGGLHVVNLYAFRATKPADLWKAADPIGPENDEVLRATFREAARENRPVVAAWGANAESMRAHFAGVLARAAGAPLAALGVTKDGAPRHPLYLRADAQLEPWPTTTPSSGTSPRESE
jgi:hypothetical protein